MDDLELWPFSKQQIVGGMWLLKFELFYSYSTISMKACSAQWNLHWGSHAKKKTVLFVTKGPNLWARPPTHPIDLGLKKWDLGSEFSLNCWQEVVKYVIKTVIYKSLRPPYHTHPHIFGTHDRTCNWKSRFTHLSVKFHTGCNKTTIWFCHPMYTLSNSFG